jgi:hypothetical protein
VLSLAAELRARRKAASAARAAQSARKAKEIQLTARTDAHDLAIKAGRVTIAGRTESSQRPLVAWPQAQSDWLANSDSSKRSHVGSTGSPRRSADPVPTVALPVSARPDEAPAQEATPTMGDAPAGRQAQGPSDAAVATKAVDTRR